MLQLTRLSGQRFALNPDLIERAEATPDTVVTLVNGSKYVIRESLEELMQLVRDYRVELVQASRTGAPHRARHTSRDPEPGQDATVVLLRAEPGEA